MKWHSKPTSADSDLVSWGWWRLLRAVGRGHSAEAKMGRPGVSAMTSGRWPGRRASGQAAAPQQGPRTIWKARA